MVSWRTGALLAGTCAIALAWQNSCLRRRLGHASADGRGAASERAAAAGRSSHAGGRGAGDNGRGSGGAADDDALAGGEAFDPELGPPPPRPHWVIEMLRPREGEDLLAYRDRLLPVAQAVVAPQRTRVAASRRDLVAEAQLDERQQAELDAAVNDAADAIVNRVWQAIATDEVWPRLRPSAGVALAADLLNAVVDADRRFRAALSDEQLAILEQSGFDLADYLLFSVRWEERFGIAPAGG